MKRVENKELINFIKTLKCISCGGVGGDAHHVTTRGAGGGDTPRNLMPLCRTCHQLIHKVGFGKAIEKHHTIGEWLKRAGRHDVLERIKR